MRKFYLISREVFTKLRFCELSNLLQMTNLILVVSIFTMYDIYWMMLVVLFIMKSGCPPFIACSYRSNVNW